MQSMMQNFYKKGKNNGKNGTKRGSKVSKKKKTMTMNDMYNTLGQDSSSKSSGTNSNFGTSSGFYQRNFEKAYFRKTSSPDDRKVSFDVPKKQSFKKKKKIFTDNDLVDDILGGRKRGDSRKSELLMMKSDLKDYKHDVEDYDDIQRFEEFLNEGQSGEEEPEDEFGGYGDDKYLNEASDEKNYESMDMTREIGNMTKEERTEYLNYKKQKKKEKKEEEERLKNSFKPKINKKSKNIDSKRMRGMQGSRGEMLFGLKKVLDYREQQLKEIVEAEKFMKFGKEELMNCTFRPKVNNKINSRITRSSIQERAEAYNQRKRMRELQRQREREQEEVLGCTFRPKINKRKKRRNGD
jgi:hypothetical protein